ncbi:MAG: hypothetical protein AUI10_09750, partial [Actinobacteria bacterium 13_2_20CM_2_72_6]
MLVARSAPECRLYLDLHPCSCGATAFPVRHVLRPGEGDALEAVYEGDCASCGLPRRFVFELDPATPPPPPAYGGPQPSRIICPGQFLLVADRAAGSAVLDPAGLDATGRAASRTAMTVALAAMDEVLKFIPDGAPAVPAAAITSPEGRAAYAREPGRFDRDRLAA